MWHWQTCCCAFFCFLVPKEPEEHWRCLKWRIWNWKDKEKTRKKWKKRGGCVFCQYNNSDHLWHGKRIPYVYEGKKWMTAASYNISRREEFQFPGSEKVGSHLKSFYDLIGKQDGNGGFGLDLINIYTTYTRTYFSLSILFFPTVRQAPLFFFFFPITRMDERRIALSWIKRSMRN